MAALGNQSIASSYEQLLHVDTDGGGNTTTLVPVKDGDNGTTFALQLSTTTAVIDNPTTSSSSQGGILRLQSDDGAVMASGHRLGVIEFGGAEDTSSTITTGARIEALTDATWSASENGADMVFYTTDGNASQTEVMRLTADNKVGIGGNPTLDVKGGTVSDTQIIGTDAGASLTIGRFSNDTGGASIILAKSKAVSQSAFNSTPVKVEDDHEVGIISFCVDDGSDLRSDVASVLAEVDDGDTTANEIGGALVLKTTAVDSNGAVERMRIDSAGNVTMPSQPAFLVHPSADQTNMANDTRVPIAMGTEIFDQGGNFASNSFTAPVDGRYQLNAIIRVNQLDIDANYHEVRIVTHNRNYVQFFSPADTDSLYFSFTVSTLADMDASDTASVDYYGDGGASQSDMIASSSFFSGHLVC